MSLNSLKQASIFFATLALVACASPARIDRMALSGADVPVTAVPAALANNIRVDSVSGGEETNPLWTSEIGSDEFRKALEQSLESAGLLNALRTGGRYALSAVLQEVKQPLFGFDTTVETRVRYRLVEAATGTLILDEEISESYTAKFSDQPFGVERLRLANEGSAKRNISRIVDRLLSLNL